MPFRVPSVRVYQELVTTTVNPTTPFMQLCVVGPVYQVETDVPVADFALSDEDYTTAYLNQTLGSVVDTSSVNIKMSDVYVKVWPANDGVNHRSATVNNDGPITKVTGDQEGDFATATIQVDDYIDLTYTDGDTVLTYSSAIQEVSSDGKTLTLKRNLPSPEGSATVTAVVKRPTKEDAIIESQFITANEDAVTINKDVKVSTAVTDTAAQVVSATVYLSYRALRQDIANDFLTITSQSNAEAKIGSVNINNPMSVAASLIASAVSDMSYRILPIETDDANGYRQALDILSTNEDIYVIVPLTNDKDVVSAYASHCTTLSEPEKSKWRIMYASQEMPSTKVMVEINDGQLVKGSTDAECYIKDTANGMFVTNNARVTDFVDIYNASNSYQYSLQIIEVLNESVVTCSTTKWMRTSEGYSELEDKVTVASQEAVKYEVVRVLDTQGVADAISGIAESFKNKRLRLVYPDTIMLNINSVSEMVPSYYLCVTLGAMRAGYPPHQGFSTIGLSGISRVLRANNMFSDDQLADMAGNGVFWVVQDTPEELPYVLYQTTTDNTQLETAEDSCVAVVDYASRYLKINLKNVLGRYNVNTISVNYVKTVINSVLDDMTSTSYQYIGPILTGAELLSVETEGDKIKPTVHIEIPYPVNGVDVTLQV